MQEIGAPSILVLVYTSAIMMILRFNVGPIVGKLGPLGLLIASASFAAVGLFLLAGAKGLAIVFIAALFTGSVKPFSGPPCWV